MLIPNNQDLTAGSGIINMPFLEAIYHSFMDEALQDLGGGRGQVIFHLDPAIQQDPATQGARPPQQYNPFFRGVAVPQRNTRTPGVQITPRDVEYSAHIRVGPMKATENTSGMGDLLDDEIQLTIVIEALNHVKGSQSFSVEGRRYAVEDTRPIGFSQRRYLMIKGKEIQEQEPPTNDPTVG